jgi:hypothetical protein
MDGIRHIPDAEWLIQVAPHPVFRLAAMLFGARNGVVEPWIRPIPFPQVLDQPIEQQGHGRSKPGAARCLHQIPGIVKQRHDAGGTVPTEGIQQHRACPAVDPPGLTL